MSLFAALLLVAASADQKPTAPPAEIELLVIELPDGARGGRGRIEGRGALDRNSGQPFFLYLLSIARECGANFPMLSINGWHYAHIISYSTSRDHEVVACLQSNMPTHFNAGVARPDIRSGFTSLNTAPFQEFEEAQGRR